jgi:hypothetical protein
MSFFYATRWFAAGVFVFFADFSLAGEDVGNSAKKVELTAKESVDQGVQVAEQRSMQVREMVRGHRVDQAETLIAEDKSSGSLDEVADKHRIAVELLALAQGARNEGNFDSSADLARRAERYLKRAEAALAKGDDARRLRILEARAFIAEKYVGSHSEADALRQKVAALRSSRVTD